MPIWTDPQNDIILEKSRDYCYLYYNCWEDNQLADLGYIGKLTFENAWAIKSLDVEFYDTYPKDLEYKFSICKVKKSL